MAIEHFTVMKDDGVLKSIFLNIVGEFLKFLFTKQREEFAGRMIAAEWQGVVFEDGFKNDRDVHFHCGYFASASTSISSVCFIKIPKQHRVRPPLSFRLVAGSPTAAILFMQSGQLRLVSEEMVLLETVVEDSKCCILLVGIDPQNFILPDSTASS